MEHNFVTDYSGKGLCKSILDTLAKFGFDASYVRNNLAGMAIDGQYIKLGVAQHMKDELNLPNVFASWVPMHRIEVMQKHSVMPDVLVKAHSLIHDCMKELVWFEI